MFAESKSLGPRGLYWMKVNLANLYGADKRSMGMRAKFVDEHWDDVVKSARDPLNHLWWNEGDEPWQILACCKELVKAVDSGDPESFKSGLFVSMDGSCNGLQHYAALARDLTGGAAVNLTPMPTPQDVYTGVLNRVLDKIDKEVSRDVSSIPEDELKDHVAARDIFGLVDRKVVKQTVMTSVYGVTFIGARQQVRTRQIVERERERRTTNARRGMTKTSQIILADSTYCPSGHLTITVSNVTTSDPQSARTTSPSKPNCTVSSLRLPPD